MILPRLEGSIAPSFRSEDVEEARFVERYLFLTTHMLQLIRDTPPGAEAGLERYLVLSLPGAPELYARCVFLGAQAACCEVAAQGPGGRRARRGALARLGYDLVCIYGSYVKQVAFGIEDVFDLAAFLLRSLYGAFLDDGATRIRFDAPLLTCARPPDGAPKSAVQP